MAPVQLSKVRGLCLDVDGVLTTGHLYYDRHGEVMKVFHVHDGQGLVAVRQAGIQLAILSARQHPAVAVRARELGFVQCIQGSTDKVADFRRLVNATGIPATAWAYIGDDLGDLGVLMGCGLPIAVANARPEARAAAVVRLAARGGEGAVRECCDMLLACRKSR